MCIGNCAYGQLPILTTIRFDACLVPAYLGTVSFTTTDRTQKSWVNRGRTVAVGIHCQARHLDSEGSTQTDKAK